MRSERMEDCNVKQIIFGGRGSLTILTALLAVCGMGSFAPAVAKLHVVTTTPDLAAIAREVGGDKVEVEALALGTQDPHFVDAKPSFILKLNRADLYVKRGLELEVGWAPVLENGSRNPRILGGPGFVDASVGIPKVEVPPAGMASRSQGDVHPLGNPHYQLDPVNAKTMARNIVDGLLRIDPDDRTYYEARLGDFDRRIDERLVGWTQTLAPFRGAKLVTYHKSWEYFAHRFGFDIVGEMEPKPGVSPSPSHLVYLIGLMKDQHVHVLIREPFYPENLTHVVAEKTGAVVLTLPESPGGVPGTDDYFSFMSYIVDHVADGLRKGDAS
jgi:zinc/manganese transport system substrate-binding protein